MSWWEWLGPEKQVPFPEWGNLTPGADRITHFRALTRTSQAKDFLCLLIFSQTFSWEIFQSLTTLIPFVGCVKPWARRTRPHELWAITIPAASIPPLSHALATFFLAVCSLKMVENQIQRTLFWRITGRRQLGVAKMEKPTDLQEMWFHPCLKDWSSCS